MGFISNLMNNKKRNRMFTVILTSQQLRRHLNNVPFLFSTLMMFYYILCSWLKYVRLYMQTFFLKVKLLFELQFLATIQK